MCAQLTRDPFAIAKFLFVLQLDSVFATAGYNGLDWMWVGIHMVIVD